MKPKKKTTNKSWWRFVGEDETFLAEQPDHVSRLYFPLCNEAGLLSAISPRLQGDIKTDQNSFLTLPVSSEDLHNTRSTRNFWVFVDGKGPWSVGGSSAQATLSRFQGKEKEKCRLEAGALWHKMSRESGTLGLRAEIINFVPATEDRVEIMQVTLTNISRRTLRLTPTAAIPIFGRSADNLRDHRHVTSLLHRVHLHRHGVLVTPTMSFDERGHRPNTTTYAVLGCEGDGEPPSGCFPTVASFLGEGGNFDAPQAVFDDSDIPDLSEAQLQGHEAVGALRFRTRKLAPGKSLHYIVLMGIAQERKEIEGWIRRLGSLEKLTEALQKTRDYWKERLDQMTIQTGDKDFNRWLRWVTLQPILRKIFGCSFLPDFDYGRGGRGWRDLWQDCLALLLLQPEEARELLLNNFGGIRMNGTNATIIGKAPGEFVADRNNFSRVWMDHGVWPWLTTELYIHQTGDLGILVQEAPYFWDQDQFRIFSPSILPSPLAGEGGRRPDEGILIKDTSPHPNPLPQGERGKIARGEDTAPRGTILEHLLVQHLTSYFNVGEHGNIRLEDADWNDGLDMAHDRGESVAFTSLYAGNLLHLAEVLQALQRERGVTEILLAEELEMLLEKKFESAGLAPRAKQDLLKAYRSSTAQGVSGRKITMAINILAEDLRAKGAALAEHVRNHEWITYKSGHGWFNGYYDNEGRRVEGDHPLGVRMTLTGQVFPIMSGVATEEQVERSFLAVKRYLQDKKLGGFRLNTDFGEIQLQLGRAFSFAYGEKENGSFFSHMVVMFANALYQRGFVKEGHEVLSSLYRMAQNAEVAKIYPGLPEYFNGEGRGMYHYLTGSASWYLLTWVTQVLGIRGHYGDLCLAPKLMPEEFGQSGQLAAEVSFAGKRLCLTYLNRGKKPYGKYRIDSILIHGQTFTLPSTPTSEVLIPRQTLAIISAPRIDITVALA